MHSTQLKCILMHAASLYILCNCAARKAEMEKMSKWFVRLFWLFSFYYWLIHRKPKRQTCLSYIYVIIFSFNFQLLDRKAAEQNAFTILVVVFQCEKQIVQKTQSQEEKLCARCITQNGLKKKYANIYCKYALLMWPTDSEETTNGYHNRSLLQQDDDARRTHHNVFGCDFIKCYCVFCLSVYFASPRRWARVWVNVFLCLL